MKRDPHPDTALGRNVTIAMRGDKFVYFFDNDLHTSHVLEVGTLHDWKPVISDWILRGKVPLQATCINK